MHISHSRVNAYLGRPYSHYLRYVEGLSSNKPARPLYFGSDFHKLLEVRNNPLTVTEAAAQIQENFWEMKPQFQEELGENYVQDLLSIFEDYQDIYKDCPQPTLTEQRFEIPMGKFKGDTVYFVGVIDEIYGTGDSIKIGEHKTFTRKPDQSLLVMNQQKCLYAKACEHMYGVMPESVIWDYIHSKPADEPVWLEKSKRFSAAKSAKITPYSWKRACEKRGITDEAVLSAGEKYADNIPNYFFRVEQDYIPEMVDSIWEGFKYTAKLICKHGKENKTKHLTPSCAWCSYQPICYAEMTGGNREYLIEKDFTKNERKE